MNAIGYLEYPAFERWAIENYPDEFVEWESDAAEWIDFDNWCQQEASHVLEDWCTETRSK